MYYNLFDSHSHSNNSPDAADPIREMADQAVAKGLQGLCITDHCECQKYGEGGYEKRMFRSNAQVSELRAEYRRRLILTRGIEVGQMLHDPDTTRRALTMLEYDFVLASVHALLGWEDFYYMSYAHMTRADVCDMMRQYFLQMQQYINMGGIDVIAHLTFPLRYLKRGGGPEVSAEDFREEIDAVLRLMVQTGVGLELNTGGLRGPVGDTAPPAWVVERYAELGGELVTIGSDAHSKFDVGEGLQHAMAVLEQAGLRYFAFYRNRKPVMLRLV